MNIQYILANKYKDVIFARIDQSNINSTIDSIYDTYYDSLWFKKAITEQEIKQSIYDKLNHPSVIAQSILCIEPKTQQVIAGYFCCDLQQYINSINKWKIYRHLELLEIACEIVVEKLKYKEIQESLWSFWGFNYRDDVEPELTKILYTLLMTQFAVEGYTRVYGFDFFSLQGNSDDNMGELTLQPIVTYTRKAFKYTKYLHKNLEKDSEYYSFVDTSIKWIQKIFESEDKQNMMAERRIRKQKVMIRNIKTQIPKL